MDIPPRPNLLWRLFVLLGLGTAGAVTVSDEAWEQYKNVAGDGIPRETFKAVFVGSVGLHALESVFVYGSSRRNGIDKPGKWARSAMLWGFPVTRRLHRAKKLRATQA